MTEGESHAAWDVRAGHGMHAVYSVDVPCSVGYRQVHHQRAMRWLCLKQGQVTNRVVAARGSVKVECSYE
jgi:hypothetical protein